MSINSFIEHLSWSIQEEVKYLLLYQHIIEIYNYKKKTCPNGRTKYNTENYCRQDVFNSILYMYLCIEETTPRIRNPIKNQNYSIRTCANCYKYACVCKYIIKKNCSSA